MTVHPMKPPRPRQRDSMQTPDGVSNRTTPFGQRRWQIVFLLVVAFVVGILLFGNVANP